MAITAILIALLATFVGLLVTPRGWHARLMQAYVVAVALAVLAAATSGCATARRDRLAVFTEQGLTAAEERWHTNYWRRLEDCRSRFEARTPEAEACFGPTYDRDAQVGVFVRASVALLRAYWVARAAGESPDWRLVMTQIAELAADLPPEAREYFERVQGLP